MKIEDRIYQLVLDRYSSLLKFSKTIGISNSTIDGVFKRGIMNSNVTTIIAICKELGISVDKLAEGKIVFRSEIVPDETIALYNKLDELDKAEIRGTIKQMLKSEKYDIKKESNSG